MPPQKLLQTREKFKLIDNRETNDFNPPLLIFSDKKASASSLTENSIKSFQQEKKKVNFSLLFCFSLLEELSIIIRFHEQSTFSVTLMIFKLFSFSSTFQKTAHNSKAKRAGKNKEMKASEKLIENRFFILHFRERRNRIELLYSSIYFLFSNGMYCSVEASIEIWVCEVGQSF